MGNFLIGCLHEFIQIQVMLLTVIHFDKHSKIAVKDGRIGIIHTLVIYIVIIIRQRMNRKSGSRFFVSDCLFQCILTIKAGHLHPFSHRIPYRTICIDIQYSIRIVDPVCMPCIRLCGRILL